jgi:hypothetical protein
MLERNPNYNRELYANNRQGHIDAVQRWKRRYPDRARDTQVKTDSRPIRKARQAARKRALYAENPEVIRTRNRAWGARNLAKKLALNAKRRAAQMMRTPKWADLKAISYFYEHCPAGHHVDHIIPLQSEIVCGLHVENNLQWLPKKENLSKRNRFDLAPLTAASPGAQS